MEITPNAGKHVAALVVTTFFQRCHNIGGGLVATHCRSNSCIVGQLHVDGDSQDKYWPCFNRIGMASVWSISRHGCHVPPSRIYNNPATAVQLFIVRIFNIGFGDLGMEDSDGEYLDLGARR